MLARSDRCFQSWLFDAVLRVVKNAVVRDEEDVALRGERCRQQSKEESERHTDVAHRVSASASIGYTITTSISKTSGSHATADFQPDTRDLDVSLQNHAPGGADVVVERTVVQHRLCDFADLQIQLARPFA